MSSVVLDSSALLALLNKEPGIGRVREVLPDSAMSTVSLSEVVAKLAEEGVPMENIRSVLTALPMEIVLFDSEQAYNTGLLRPETKNAGLSLGDRACLNLAMLLGVPAVTADRQLEVASTRVEVEFIR